MNVSERSPEVASETKTCGKCGLNFVGKRCRPCATKYAAEHRRAHPEKYKAAHARYLANSPEKAKAKMVRYRQNPRERPCYKCGVLFTGATTYCIACEKAYKAAWHQANKLKNKPNNTNPVVRLKNKRLAEQRRRARKRAMPDAVSTDIVAKLLVMQKGRCACCKAKFTDSKYELDHIEPLAKGGRHADDNLQLLCMHCNRTKADKDPISFMQQLGFLL